MSVAKQKRVSGFCGRSTRTQIPAISRPGPLSRSGAPALAQVPTKSRFLLQSKCHCVATTELGQKGGISHGERAGAWLRRCRTPCAAAVIKPADLAMSDGKLWLAGRISIRRRAALAESNRSAVLQTVSEDHSRNVSVLARVACHLTLVGSRSSSSPITPSRDAT